MRSLVTLLASIVVLAVAVAACESSEDSPEGAACTPGNGSFGTRCCEPGDCTGEGLECRAGQCTKPCDGGAACEGLAADGGARPCTGGYCVPPPLPPSGGADDGSGW